ncbi:MAG: MFS transporter [Coriobacteriia bacterium]
MSGADNSTTVVRTYLTANGLFTLAASLVWAVNTLFLLEAGLDIFTVMVVNASFTIGQLVFEVPTGVVADTIGRKASFLLGIGALIVATLMYVLAAQLDLGIGVFVLASVLLGFGFTCQTGAMDAWLVDALAYTGYARPLDGVFARGQIVFGVAMIAGTLGGGFLGQWDLAIPYYVRSVVLVLAFAFVAVSMRDVGFEARPLTLGSFGDETRLILRAGSTYGWRKPVVRLLFFAAAAQGVFFFFGFYSWQRYFLDLLARELVWVNGLVTAAFAVAGIVGNALVQRVMRESGERRNAANVLALMALVQALLIGAIALVGLLVPETRYGVGPFLIAVGLYLAFGVASGIQGPVRQAFLNRQIPSAQRATILSLDAFFGDGGASVGQLGLGWVARAVSIPAAWAIGGVSLLVAVPFYRASRSGDNAPAGDSIPQSDEE